MQRQKMDEKLNDVSLDGTNFAATLDGNTGAEFRLPPVSDALRPQYLLPFLTYLLLFQFIGMLMKRYAWKNATGFR